MPRPLDNYSQIMSCDQNSPVSVLIHPSQFPGAIEASLRESLRTREMNHKFHYDTPKQTQRWLRLHEAFSPARTDSAKPFAPGTCDGWIEGLPAGKYTLLVHVDRERVESFEFEVDVEEEPEFSFRIGTSR